MNGFLDTKEKLMELYAQHSKIIDKVVNFVLALVTFMMINSNLGFMKTLDNPLVALALAVVCAFLPKLCTVLIAVGMSLAHLFSLSMGVCIVAAVIVIIMFIFYFSFTAKKAIILLLTPICFALHVPFVVPVIYGLSATPVNMVPIACGTIAYYGIEYIKANAATLGEAGAAGMVTQLTTVSKAILTNKEMWIAVLAMAICIVLVYAIRRNSIDQSWKLGIVIGTVVGAIVFIFGSMTVGGKAAFVSTILGAAVAVAVGFVMELFIFSVDYSRTEKLQFEDDDYYYYVKAVPKINVAPPEKVVKRINQAEENPRRKRAEGGSSDNRKSQGKRSASTRNSQPQRRKTEHMTMGQTDELLLAKSLEKELDIRK